MTLTGDSVALQRADAEAYRVSVPCGSDRHTECRGTYIVWIVTRWGQGSKGYEGVFPCRCDCHADGKPIIHGRLA